MDLRYGREVTVGTLVIIAILVFVFGTMWLSGRSIRADNVARVQFSDVSGLKRASPVRVSGMQVGKVERIELEQVGKVMVLLSLPDRLQPKVDASAQIVSISLVGDYAVEFNPGQAAQPLPPNRVIIGTVKSGLTDRAASLTDKADSILVGAQAIINRRTADQLYITMQALQGTLQAAQRTMDLYGNPNRGPSAELTATMASMRRLSDRLDTALAHPALSRTLQRTDTLAANLAAMTKQFTSTGARLDSLLARVDRGEGTFGKLAHDSTLYWNVVHLTASMDSLLVEIKRNPGKIQLNVPVKVF